MQESYRNSSSGLYPYFFAKAKVASSSVMSGVYPCHSGAGSLSESRKSQYVICNSIIHQWGGGVPATPPPVVKEVQVRASKRAGKLLTRTLGTRNVFRNYICDKTKDVF